MKNELNMLILMLQQAIEILQKMQQKKKLYKCTELALTGNIPPHPHYIYEYELPKDMAEPIEILPYYPTNEEIKFEVMQNSKKEAVLCCNQTPVCLKYYTKEEK